jgi:uncharacterized protein with HEPN domain
MNKLNSFKRDKIFIQHILESINLIEQYIEDKDQEDFLNIRQLQDSIIRRIEIIGEAVKNLTDDFKVKYNEISWREIAGMRDILIHQYFGIDLNLTWKTIKEDLPQLKENLNKILKNH